ncbi:MAG: hypothetical protein ACO3A4_15135 [Silvanigrellaceae bacterium]
MKTQSQTVPFKIKFSLTTFLILAVCFPKKAEGQFAGVVPQGVLAVVGAHRTYLDQNSTWNAKGVRTPLSNKAQLNFDGEHLLRGEGGAKLQSLAEILKGYDSNPDDPGSVVRRLNLGVLNVGGSGKLNIQYFGLALGLPNKQSIYLAAPIVDLQVKTGFTLTGSNNASEIRNELGELAYQPVRDGLETASKINERDIKASIEAAEYTGVDSWRYRNFADVILGYATELVSPNPALLPEGDFSLEAEAFVSAPTGHVDNPDVLSDVSIGNGTWGIGFGLTPKVSFESFSLGIEANATAWLPSKQKMRIPFSDETIISASRRTTVNYRTAPSWEMTAVFAGNFDWFQPQYRAMLKRHERDSISGPISGNYTDLMKATERTQIEHALWLYFSTIDMFKRNEFPIPLRFKVAANQIIKGFNSFDETFFEVQLVGFLPTPWMPD